MSGKWHVWQELLKPTLKIWKSSYDWMTWFRQQSEGINFIVIQDLNLWQILAEVLDSPKGKNIVYDPNGIYDQSGKDIMASIGYTLKVYSPHGKSMVSKW